MISECFLLIFMALTLLIFKYQHLEVNWRLCSYSPCVSPEILSIFQGPGGWLLSITSSGIPGSLLASYQVQPMEALASGKKGEGEGDWSSIRIYSLPSRCSFSAYVPPLRGFLTLALLTFGDKYFFVVGSVLCIIGCLAASLTCSF